MSKRLIIFIYVLAVLIFSGFIAQAKTIQEYVGVHTARVDQNSGTLFVTGRFATPCYTKPVLVIQKIDEMLSQIYFSVSADNNAHICTQVLGPEFEISINLNELSLTGGKEYSLIINNYNGPKSRLTFVAHTKNQNHSYLPKKVYSGHLQILSHAYALIKNGEALAVSSDAFDISRHLNRKVWITGYAAPSTTESVLIPVSISSLY